MHKVRVCGAKEKGINTGNQIRKNGRQGTGNRKERREECEGEVGRG